MDNSDPDKGQWRKQPWLIGIGLFILGIIVWGGFHTAIEKTNSLEFCISCHEMESTVYQEYKTTIHYSNSTGVRAECHDCHVPKEWLPKVIRKIQASKELYYWLVGSIDSKEKFEANRLRLAQRVWHTMQATDSRECRNCHRFTVMDLEQQGLFAGRTHGDALDTGETCIDCHQGIAHNLPQQPAGETDTMLVSGEIDIEYGEEIMDTCAGCHGEFGEGSQDGEYPRLAGLDANYIAKQIRDFKTRERLNIPMLPYATERELPEEDVRIISLYLAGIDLPTKLDAVNEDDFDAFERLQSSKQMLNIARYDGNTAAGGRLYQRECAGCHGMDGLGKGSAPRLNGQRSQYLKIQIEKYRKAERIHDDPRDAELFSSIQDADIDDILAYLSILDDV